MIEDPPLLHVRRSFARTTGAQIEAFYGLQTGFVVDAMNGRGGMDGRIKPIGDSRAFCGVALPCFARSRRQSRRFRSPLGRSTRRCRRERDGFLRRDRRYGRPPAGYDEESRRCRVRDRRFRPPSPWYPVGGSALLRRRVHPELGGPQRTWHGRPSVVVGAWR